MQIISLVVMFLLILIIVFIITQHSKQIEEIEDQHKEEIKIQRAQAIAQSKAVTRGQVTEQMLPLFPDFPYKMSECKFSGQPIDYIVFEGMDTFRDAETGQISIIFADVKVGSAQRTKVQNGIKKAVEEGRVRFETWIVNNNKIKIK